MLDLSNFDSFWIEKSNVKLNVEVSAFPSSQSDLLKKLIEIFTMLV